MCVCVCGVADVSTQGFKHHAMRQKKRSTDRGQEMTAGVIIKRCVCVCVCVCEGIQTAYSLKTLCSPITLHTTMMNYDCHGQITQRAEVVMEICCLASPRWLVHGVYWLISISNMYIYICNQGDQNRPYCRTEWNRIEYNRIEQAGTE